MKDSHHVLAESDSPIGAMQLIAYRQDGATWVGVARRDSGERPEAGLIEAVGLRTGSHEMRINASVSSDQTFSYVAGAVTPEIVRAEVRDADGHVFPATIVDIPDEIEQEYRAVWAILDDVHRGSQVVGYDERGQLYDETDPRVSGPLPTTEERIAAIRDYADKALRYHATAILREPEDQRHLRSLLAQAALFMALLEADAADPRTVMARRDKIEQRYIADVKENPWLPPEAS